MAINSLVLRVFSGKNKSPALLKNPFFTTISSRNRKCVWKVYEMTFSGYYAKPTLCKECNQKRWLQSDVSPHKGRNKIYSLPIQPHLVFKSAVIRSKDLLFYSGNQFTAYLSSMKSNNYVRFDMKLYTIAKSGRDDLFALIFWGDILTLVSFLCRFGDRDWTGHFQVLDASSVSFCFL